MSSTKSKSNDNEIIIEINQLDDNKATLLNDILNKKKLNPLEDHTTGLPLQPITLDQKADPVATSIVAKSANDTANTSEIDIQVSDTTGFEFEVILKPGEKPPDIARKTKKTPLKIASNTNCKSPSIQRGSRKNFKEQKATEIVIWELGQLETQKDPLALGIKFLFQSGVKNILFLSIQPDPGGSVIPHFQSSATVSPRERLMLWTGLKWQPRIVPEVWNQFVKTGFVELPPPATMTNIMSTRNVIRGAFGITHQEWLSLIRVGELSSCRGVIAAISEKSLKDVALETLKILGQTVLKKAA
ncbi:MAG: hypothetical protein HY843_03130 [Bdellovibrio sp.]|nr:hypothetical protein [Bdellovibrio sp.]